MHTGRVFVNSYRAICSAASSSSELFEAICNKRSGIEVSSSFLKDKIVGIGISKINLQDALFSEISSVLKSSNLENFKETLLLVGSSVGGMKLSEKIYLEDNSYKNIDPNLHNIDSIASQISKNYTFKDDISFSTACTSSANALGYAYEVISKGICANVLVVGYDALCKTTVGGFRALGVLSEGICRPFDKNRDGMNVAEGLAVLLLQNRADKEAVEVCGVGYSSDAFHMTKPSPDGAKKAMQNALLCRDLNPQDIDYINAHGTGTKANDKSEANAISSLFDKEVCVSSTKSITGHTLGAAGALEAIVCIMSIQQQKLPPNSNLNEPENKDIKYVFTTQNAKIDYVLSNSFAFGGNNTSLLFGRVQ